MIGRFEYANGGTILLDEIGELPLELQSSLLRVLEEKVIQRVGSSDNIPVDIRVIAATNRDLFKAVRKGQFREDLYYRLNVVDIQVPRLSERKDDIVLLAQFYLDKLSKQIESTAKSFSPQALEDMRNYSWPGNVRQLINCVARATILCEGSMVKSEDLGLSVTVNNHHDDKPEIPLVVDSLKLRDVRYAAEHLALSSALDSAQQNITIAAEQLGVSRVTMYKLLKKHDLVVDRERPVRM
jgi:DNA-binding NtrC family response regulator